VDHLKETHPDLVNVIRIGKSSQGRPIKVIHLSSGRDEQKAKKAIFIDAGKVLQCAAIRSDLPIF
jgi:Zinc carboxypeptidase